MLVAFVVTSFLAPVRIFSSVVQPDPKLIVNVGGKSPQITNAGFSGASDTLWNFYEATTFQASSVGIPGTVLAPLADVRISGVIDGGLIAENVWSTNEFHYAPFSSTWLVP